MALLVGVALLEKTCQGGQPFRFQKPRLGPVSLFLLPVYPDVELLAPSLSLLPGHSDMELAVTMATTMLPALMIMHCKPASLNMSLHSNRTLPNTHVVVNSVPLTGS